MPDYNDEGDARCVLSQPKKQVEDTEELALIVYHDLLCDEHGHPTEGAFRYNCLLLTNTDNETFPHNKCGQSEGVSLDRDPSGRKEELVAKCLTLSEAKSQTPKRFAVAKAINLRNIRFNEDETGRRGGGKHLICSSDQIVFILADGGDNNPYHAIVRLHEKIDRSLYKKLLEPLMAAFTPFSEWSEGKSES